MNVIHIAKLDHVTGMFLRSSSKTINRYFSPVTNILPDMFVEYDNGYVKLKQNQSLNVVFIVPGIRQLEPSVVFQRFKNYISTFVITYRHNGGIVRFSLIPRLIEFSTMDGSTKRVKSITVDFGIHIRERCELDLNVSVMNFNYWRDK